MALSATPLTQRARQILRGALDKKLTNRYRTLLYRLPGVNGSGEVLLRTLGVTTCQRKEGSSSVAAHLALTAAATWPRRVLLVDANLAAPGLHRFFGGRRGDGLGNALAQPAEVASYIRPTDVDNLSWLSAGSRAQRGVRGVDAAQWSSVLKTLRSGFDLMIFDLPATTVEPATLHLAGLLDGVLLVVEAERTRWEVVREVKEQLVRAQVNLLGVVLNKWHD
jgi:Mrp family chromosome partitioning ATPase